MVFFCCDIFSYEIIIHFCDFEFFLKESTSELCKLQATRPDQPYLGWENYVQVRATEFFI